MEVLVRWRKMTALVTGSPWSLNYPNIQLGKMPHFYCGSPLTRKTERTWL